MLPDAPLKAAQSGAPYGLTYGLTCAEVLGVTTLRTVPQIGHSQYQAPGGTPENPAGR